MQKNVPGQRWKVFAFDTTTSVEVTGDAANITANLKKDYGAAAATNDVNPTELEDGFYYFDLTQAETNAGILELFPESSTPNVQVIPVPASYTTIASKVVRAEASKLILTPQTIVLRPTITDQPDSASVTVGFTATFTVAATTPAPHATITYQWQVNTGSSWANISAATSASYTTPTLTIGSNGYLYRCVVSNVFGSENSSSATLTVSEASTKVLVVAFGESNAGGYALNTDAESWELASRSELQMWNVSSALFQALDIGTNNNLDHAGLNSTTHGWELGLANRVRQGYFGSRTVYYCQTGQGASTVSQWNDGGSYWTKFVSRTTGAKAALASGYDVAVWATLGINDAIAGTVVATYKSSFIEIIGRIKTELPGCKIYINTLPTTSGSYAAYTTAIREIVAEDPTNLRVVESETPIAVDMRDTNHWSYLGMKRLAARYVDATLTDISLAGRGLTWSAREDSNFNYTTAIDQHSFASETIDLTTAGYIAATIRAEGSGNVVILDDSTNAVNWGAGADPYYGAMYYFGGAIVSASANGAAVGSYGTAPMWGRLRWNKSINDNLVMESSTDGGATWTLRETFTNVLSGVTTARVKTLSAVGAGDVDIWTG